MQYQIRKHTVILAVLLSLLLSLGGIEASFAAPEVINDEDVTMAKEHWPMAVWYGLSVVLALVGYMKAKSKS